MTKSELFLNLSDLLDIKHLQEFQDAFASSMKMASITVDNKGPITRPSNFTSFCTKCTRGTELGRKRCVECDIQWGKIAAERGEPVIYTCHSGLTDFAVPIIVGGKHIASILGGQVLTEKPNEEHFRNIAREIGANEDEYIEAVKKIEIVPLEKIEKAAQLLFIAANSISDVGHKSLKLYKKNRDEELYKIIMKTIRSTLDIKETKTRIVNIIGQTLNADRCFIMEYDKHNDAFLDIENEYLSSKDILPYQGKDLNTATPNFSKMVKSGKPIIVDDKKIISAHNHCDFEPELAAIQKYDVKAAFVFPLNYSNELIGALIIHYVNKNHNINNEEISLFNMIGDQIAIALHQAKLYEKTQIQAQREKVLREVTTAISSTLDINKIKKILVEKLGEILGSDLNILFVQDPITKKFMPVDEHSFHISSPEIQSPLGRNLIEEYNLSNIVFKNKSENIAYDRAETLIEKHYGTDSRLEEAINRINIKSLIAIPIIYADTYLGFLSLNFINKHKNFTEDDINLVKTIADQSSIALYHAGLYTKAKEAARTKGDFIANMSHELKTPLNIIIGFSDVLTGAKVSPNKQMEYLKNINKSGKHLLGLTNDIINISKIESGNFNLEFETINSKQVILDVVNSIKLIAEDKNININVNLIDANINADKKMFSQILYNLTTNAIKFTPANGKITIESILENEKLIVSVVDTGIGIETKNQELIFEKFKQVDSSYSKTQQGAGLGLSIAKRLIELHNGSIHVESDENKGSRFWFCLPSAESFGTQVAR